MNVEEYQKVLKEKRSLFHNSIYIKNEIFCSHICLSGLRTVGSEELIWNIDRFHEDDPYIRSLGHKQEALDLGFKAAQEVIAESFLSDVFMNKDGNYLEEGLYVDVSGKYPHAAIWAALVQTRIFYEFPSIAKYYFIYREKGFSVDQSVVFCQVLNPKSMVFGTKVNAHGTTPSYGTIGCNSLKKYFAKKWEYINSLRDSFSNSGAGSFSNKAFSYVGKSIGDFESIDALYNIFNGEHDA